MPAVSGSSRPSAGRDLRRVVSPVPVRASRSRPRPWPAASARLVMRSCSWSRARRAAKSPGSAGARAPTRRSPGFRPSTFRPRRPGYRTPIPTLSRALRRAQRPSQPDVVHANSPFTSGLMARAVARRSGAPLVFTHHTRFAEYGHYLGPLAPVSGRAAEAWLAAWWAGCAAIVAPSESLAAEIRGRPRRNAGCPIVRAIPTGDRRGGHRRPARGPSSAAGRLAPGRGHRPGQPRPGRAGEVGGRPGRRLRHRRSTTAAAPPPARGRRPGRGGRGSAGGSRRSGGSGPRHRSPAAGRGPVPGEGLRPVRVRLADRDPGPGPGRGPGRRSAGGGGRRTGGDRDAPTGR